MAEAEIAIMNSQCLDRRLESRGRMAEEVAAWEGERNRLSGKVDWRFTTEDARIKLKRLYPSIDV